MPVMSRAGRSLCRSDTWATVTRRSILPWALQGADLSGRWLEVGAGAGVMSEPLLTAYPEVDLTVTDLDPGMIAAGRERLDRFADRSRLEVADATRLPHATGAFDGTVTFLMLHHVGDWRTALAEMVRVTRPGGQVIGYDLLDTVGARLMHLLDRSRHSLVTAGQLGRTLAALPVEVEFRRIEIFGALMRFRARVLDG